MLLFIILISLSYVNAQHYDAKNANDKRKLNEEVIFGDVHDEWTTTIEPTTSMSPCKLDELVQCLFEPLDEWAMVLYSLKENIVAISSQHCDTTRDVIRRCVEETAIHQLQCDQKTILTVAARVTDLLLHKKNSGNLLRSYYVTAYVCTEEGRLLRGGIRSDCLLQERLGQMAFDAMKYIDDHLINNQSATSEERCSFLTHRAHLMRSVGDHKCDSHEPMNAGILMCETIKMAFLKMYPDIFGSGRCDFSCESDSSGVNMGGGRRTAIGGKHGQPTGLQTDSGHSQRPHVFLVILAICLIK